LPLILQRQTKAIREARSAQVHQNRYSVQEMSEARVSVDDPAIHINQRAEKALIRTAEVFQQLVVTTPCPCKASIRLTV
jgi:hypothetical protein